MHKKVPEKNIQACVLVEFVYEQVLKTITEFIVFFIVA